jgi:anti-sigma factor RsiW
MSDMFCTYAGDRDEMLVAYLYDDIRASDRSAFESHLAACSVCTSELASLGAVREQLAQWTPPDLQSAGRREQVAPSPVEPRRRWWEDVPAWAQLAAALLVLGVAAGAANLNIHYDQSGLSVRTGWMRPPAASDAASGQATPWRADLTRLEQEIRAELRPASVKMPAALVAQPALSSRAGSSDAEILRKVKALIEESEKTEQIELALRVAQVLHDVQAQRLADLARIDHNFGLIQNNTGFEIARQRELVNSLAVRVVSQSR